MTISVLIVDDSEHFRRAAVRSLRLEADMTVLDAVASGPAGIDAAQRLQPDFVLIDVSMPGMNGLDATPRIRQVAPAAHIILLTGHDADAYESSAVRAGAHAVLGKWAFQEEAVECIRRLADAQSSSEG